MKILNMLNVWITDQLNTTLETMAKFWSDISAKEDGLEPIRIRIEEEHRRK